jgi:hypothetical protein
MFGICCIVCLLINFGKRISEFEEKSTAGKEKENKLGK